MKYSHRNYGKAWLPIDIRIIAPAPLPCTGIAWQPALLTMHYKGGPRVHAMVGRVAFETVQTRGQP